MAKPLKTLPSSSSNKYFSEPAFAICELGGSLLGLYLSQFTINTPVILGSFFQRCHPMTYPSSKCPCTSSTACRTIYFTVFPFVVFF